MNLKAICTTILVVCSITLLNAQSKELFAKSAMLNADESYNNGKFQDCIKFLMEAEKNLGETNSRIQYLKVKASMAQADLVSVDAKKKWLSFAECELTKFFEITDENKYVPEKYEEMVLALSKVKQNIVEADVMVNREFQKKISDLTSIISEEPTNAEAYKKRGYEKFVQYDYLGAIQDYNKAIELSPSNIMYFYYRGSAKGLSHDQKGALQDYNKAIELSTEPGSSLYNLRGDTKLCLKDYQGAIQDYSKSIELSPTDCRLYERRGNAKYGLKDYEGAIQDYTKAIELDIEGWCTYGNYFLRGRIFQTKLKDVEAAKKDFEKVLLLSEDGYNSSLSNYYLGRKEKAYDLVNKSLKNNCDQRIQQDTYFSQACLYSLDNYLPEAINALKNALEHGFNDFDSMETIEELDNIRNSAEFKELINNYKNK